MKIFNGVNRENFTLKIGEKDLEVEINDLTSQANGSALVKCGDTLVLSTCVMSKEDRENLGFFPLIVEYQEKYYASGKIKGARYVRREGKPSDEAVLNSRMIDRCIRPLFPKNLKREVQVISTVLAWDEENDPDIIALISASVALSVSDIPFSGPIGAVRISQKDGEFFVNKKSEEGQSGDNMDVVFAGTEKDGEILTNMIEGGFDQIKEEEILKASDIALKEIKKIIDFQKEIQKTQGKKKLVLEEKDCPKDLVKEMEKFLKDNNFEKVFFEKDKQKMQEGLDNLKKVLTQFVEEKYSGDEEKIKYAGNFFEEEIDRLFHENIIKYNKRPDGRGLEEVREVNCEVGLFRRAHGSGLFCRGLTKSLSILTLGAPDDQQLLEGMQIVGKKRFMHHYNFLPFSVGEVGFLRGPGRREIGHGILAEKALLPVIPNVDEFPYTIRIVSEILSSNGSSSQASASSSCLALMDAGVPIKEMVTGIAIGLAGDKVLTDIQGPEDHYGDMDFKVAGTKNGITAIQMDVKIEGINRQIMEKALAQAKKARLEILQIMTKAIDKPRPELSTFAPRILILQIKPDKIREVIGTGGKVINEIIDETGAKIDIEDSGLIYITSDKEESAQKALLWIKNIVREVEVGEIFEGKVKRILEFGAFVEILPGQEGLVHISKLSSKRVERVEDVVQVGDEVAVKVISIDEIGRINLSLISKK